MSIYSIQDPTQVIPVEAVNFFGQLFDGKGKGKIVSWHSLSRRKCTTVSREAKLSLPLNTKRTVLNGFI